MKYKNHYTTIGILLVCSLVLPLNGCALRQYQKQNVAVETTVPDERSSEEKFLSALEEAYPGKEFVIEGLETVDSEIMQSYDKATVRCVNDGIEFSVNPTYGIEEYQMKLWNLGFYQELNEVLDGYYGEDYGIDPSWTYFVVYGYNREHMDFLKSIGHDFKFDFISKRFYNTTYQEAVEMQSKEEDPVETEIFIHCYVYTEQVDKEKEIEVVKDLYRKFVWPVKDQIDINYNNEEDHRRMYVIEMTYLDPSAQSVVELYHNYPPADIEARKAYEQSVDYKKKYFEDEEEYREALQRYKQYRGEMGDNRDEYHQMIDEAINTYLISSAKFSLQEEKDLETYDFLGLFKY